jgi:sugar phosphate isomerase/epimerase
MPVCCLERYSETGARMYISLNGTLTANRVPWPEFARLAAETGYLGVDVNIGKAMEEGLETTRALLAKSRLKPAVASLPVEFKKDESEFQKGMAGLADAAQFASAIGCPRMGTWLLASSPIPNAEQRKIYLDRLRAICDLLARNHVRLAIEFVSPVHLRKLHPHEFIYRMDEMLELAKDAGSNAGVMLDSWHWHHAGGTTADIIAGGKDRIVHVQVADAPKLPPEQIKDGERLLPGEGIIDFNAFFAALKKIGYTGGVSPEVFGRGLKDMPPEQGAKLGLQTTTSVMKKAQVL